ncbi:MAG: hypothetical protein WCG99_02475 [Candidatus Berkelbacteria bacterium]
MPPEEAEFNRTMQKKPKSITFLWVAVLVLFVASAAVIFGIWTSYKTDRASNNLARLNNIESGDVMGATTEDPEYLVKLTDNLKAAGVTIYGSSTDQKTAKQLVLFGQAATRLDYVECNSQSADSNSDECIARGITHYPTWVKADKKITGYQTLADLEKFLAN